MKAYTAFIKPLKIASLVLAILSLQACSVGGKTLKEANSLQDVTDRDIILVGTIALTPPLHEGEQIDPAAIYGVANQKNRAMIQVNHLPQSDGYSYMLNPELGKRFFIRVPREMFYLVDGWIYMAMRRSGIEKLRLPTHFKFNVNPEDRAVYIGKITYERDDFNSVIKIRLDDNYNAAAKEFQERFGGNTELKKSLISQI